MESLRQMSESENEKRETRQEASNICSKLETLEMAFLCVFWNTVLETMQNTTIYLQKSSMNLHAGIKLLKSLIGFLEEQRKKLEEFENKAKTVTGVSKEYTSNKRTIKRNKFADDTSPSIDATIQMSARDKFKIFTFFLSSRQLVHLFKEKERKICISDGHI